MSAITIPARLIEGAIHELKTLLIANFNINLEAVYEYWKAFDGTGSVNVPRISNDKWYIVEGITPLQPPAGFIVGVRSQHDLTVQSAAKQTHNILVSVLGQEVEATRLTKMAYRYGTALWMTLRDANTPTCHILARSLDYSPIYVQNMGPSGERQFSKDVTVQCDVLQYERF